MRRAAVSVAVILVVIVGVALRGDGGDLQLPPRTVAAEFGSSVGAAAREPLVEAERIAAAIEEPLRLVRHFQRTSEPFPDPLGDALIRSGADLVLSLQPRTRSGAPIPWRDWAETTEDDELGQQLVRIAQDIARRGGVHSVTFHHEPESGQGPFGEAVDYVAAFRNVVAIMRPHGPAELEFSWLATSFGFEREPDDARAAPRYYPRSDVVDWIGVDAYNWFGCRTDTPGEWRRPREVLGSFLAFAGQHPDAKVMIAEIASTEDPADPERKGAWIDDLTNTLRDPALSRVEVVLWFHGPDPDSDRCDWWIDSSPAATAAIRDLAASLRAIPTPVD